MSNTADGADAKRKLKEESRKLGFLLALGVAVLIAGLLFVRSRRPEKESVRPPVVNALGGGFLPKK